MNEDAATAFRDSARSRVIVIGGPTASGKSALALDLADRLGGEVINGDSMQLYADLRILTARPPQSDTQRVAHRLYGVLDGDDASSVARWRDDAEAAIRAALARGRAPIVVGGTGLYLKALTEGLSPVPPSDADLRDQAVDLHRRLGARGFHADLARLDPVMAERLPPGDTQRCIRAWEVVTGTGRSLAEWQRMPAAGAPEGLSFAYVVLLPDRRPLYEACDGRFRRMVAAGALAEVERLMDRRLPPERPIMKAVGVQELAAHLSGRATLEEAVRAASTATRRYAKRQLTWFRRQPAAGAGLDAGADSTGSNISITEQYSKRLASEILSLIRFSR